MPDIYQNYAGYRPPSVHISRVKEVTPQPAGVVRQVPLIIGQGPSIKSIEAVITKGEGDKDTLPSTTVMSIVAVGNRRNTESYIKGTDYQLSGVNQIEWLSDGNAPPTGATYYVYYKARPEESQYELYRIPISERALITTLYGDDLMEHETYLMSDMKTVTDTYTSATTTYSVFTGDGGVSVTAGEKVGYCQVSVNETIYKRDIDYTINELQQLVFLDGDRPSEGAEFTVQFKIATPTIETIPNPIALGAKIVLEEGAPEVFCLQVQPSGKDADYDSDTMPDPYGTRVSDWAAALNDHVQYERDIHTIVPMTHDATIFEEVETRVLADSSVEEAKPRVIRLPIYLDYTDEDKPSSPEVFDEMYEDFMEELNRHRMSRIVVPFPFSAYKTLSDGNEYLLSAEYIAAALAGQEAATPKQLSLNNHIISSFTRLGITKLTTLQLNKLAAAGATVLTQTRLSDPITIRDWISTDRTDQQSEEPSIQNVYDYAWLAYLNAISPYLRDQVINASLIKNIRDTLVLESEKMGLSGLGLIDSAEVTTVAQDSSNKRRIYAKVRIYMQYPAKYFDIEVVTV